jgi:hypothetical protein
MALGQHKRRQSLGLRQQLGLARQIARKEVLEDAAVGRVGHYDDGGVVKREDKMVSTARPVTQQALVKGETTTKESKQATGDCKLVDGKRAGSENDEMKESQRRERERRKRKGEKYGWGRRLKARL